MKTDPQQGEEQANNSKAELDQASVYSIRIKGHLAQEWSDWFGGMSITPDPNGETLLTGAVRDQAALHGLLKRVRDLGLPLLALKRMDHDQERKGL